MRDSLPADAAVLATVAEHPGWLAAVRAQLEPGPGGCLLWQGTRTRGHGVIYIPARPGQPGRTVRVHRALLVAQLGRPLALGYHAGHACHDMAHAAGLCPGGGGCQHRACANVEHLAEQSPRANALAGAGLAARNAAVTACPAGHPLTPGNLTRASWARGRRECLQCNRTRARAAQGAAAALGLTREQYRAGRDAAARAAARGWPTLPGVADG